MQDLLSKEHYCYKIYTSLFKNSPYPTPPSNFSRQPQESYENLKKIERPHPPPLLQFFKVSTFVLQAYSLILAKIHTILETVFFKKLKLFNI